MRGLEELMQEPHGAWEPLNKYHYSLGILRLWGYPALNNKKYIIFLSEIMEKSLESLNPS